MQLAPPAAAQETMAFQIRVHGNDVGEENDEVTRGATTSARSTLRYRVDGKVVIQTTDLELGAGNQLRHYQWQEGVSTISVKYVDTHLDASYAGGAGTPAKEFEFFMPASTAILDVNSYVDWELLADRYDSARGGTQEFAVFVPHSGDPGKVRLTLVGAPDRRHLHLHAATDEAELELYLSDGRLMRLEMPAAGLQVERMATR